MKYGFRLQCAVDNESGHNDIYHKHIKYLSRMVEMQL